MKAEKLTKEMLLSYGIDSVSEDGKCITQNGKLLKQYKVTTKHKFGNDKTYLALSIYDHNERVNASRWSTYHRKDGTLVRRRYNYTGYKGHTLLVHRVVYAWFNGECDSGLDVDHIDNNPFNNALSNLQLVTRSENLKKRPHSGANQYTYKRKE